MTRTFQQLKCLEFQKVDRWCFGLLLWHIKQLMCNEVTIIMCKQINKLGLKQITQTGAIDILGGFVTLNHRKHSIRLFSHFLSFNLSFFYWSENMIKCGSFEGYNKNMIFFYPYCFCFNCPINNFHELCLFSSFLKSVSSTSLNT